MAYVWLHAQIRHNNIKSAMLLLAFPWLILWLVWLFIYILRQNSDSIHTINQDFVFMAPYICIIVAIWFIIAYFNHASIIESATWSRPLERKENTRIYNLVENLCIWVGMKMPKIDIIDDNSLNAFASWLSQNTFTLSLSKWIIDKLDDNELESVIAHELTHIRNRDVRLLVISIVFVGIFSFVAYICFRSRWNKDNWLFLLLWLVLALVWYFLSTVFRFSLSRKREFLADAGAAEMTRNPRALASALRKISKDSVIEAVERKDVAQMFIDNPSVKSSFFWIFDTHPPIQERIRVLEEV